MSKHNKQDIITRSIQVHGSLYDYSKSTPTIMAEKMSVICSIHGIYLVSPSSHIYKKCGCPKCKYDKMMINRKSTNSTWSTSQFVDVANIKHNNQYDYSLVQYKNAHTKVTIICNQHGNFTITPSDHIRGNNGFGSGCQICSPKISKPEQLIYQWLTDNGIKFIHQYKYDDLMSDTHSKLIYDFYLPTYNILIEYDGIQHYKSVSKYPVETFERTKLHDKLKNDYAINNNITLIRIPYYTHSIIGQLKSELIPQFDKIYYTVN